MKKSRELSARDGRVARRGKNTKRRKIDFSDIPELSDRQLSLMRRLGRPPLGDQPRKLIAIRMDPNQSLINDILAGEMKQAR